MSTLKALLKDVPLEWKTLGEVSTIMRGASPRPIAKYITDDENGVPWIKIGDTSPNSKYVISTSQKITYQGALQSRVLEVGDFIISNSMSFGRPYILNIKGAIHDGWAAISNYQNVLEPDFLYFYLSSSLVQNFWQSKINSGSVSNLNADIIRSLPIPIIAKTIQQEIVRVLDALSEQNKALTTALAQEIDKRKKQYEYYREELFRFEGKEVEWKTLGEVAEKITSGGTPKTSMPDYYNGNIPWLRTQEVGHGDIYDTEIKITKLGLDNSSAKIIPANCIIVAMYGATVGKVGINKIPLATNQACSNIQLNAEIMLYKFLYHFLKSKYEYIKSLGTGPQTNINAGIIKSLSIPIASIQEQERIVHLLDQFDEATKNIVAQLEKEIELRNKQYEYYRNQLLSFPN